ncbi:MAG TPA: EAL domain-containing protein [Gammaproteobacteria bacterium]|nr:EAL domain-containing protein [Gammaproteobacteria bacterium]
MDSLNPVSPLKSKLGREIYTVAALLASVPLLLIGSISLYEIDSEHRAQVQRTMDQAIQSFGEMAIARFRQAGDLAALLIDARLEPAELPHSYVNYVVFDNGETVHSTFGQYGEPDFPVTGTAEQPQLTMTSGQPQGQVFLSMRSESRTFIGQLDPNVFWNGARHYASAIEFCVLSTAAQSPVFCSSPLPTAQLSALLEQHATNGNFVWESEGESWQSFHTQYSLTGSFDAEPIHIVASQPAAIAYAAANAFRRAYVPALIVTLVVTLLGAGYHARRLLWPLSQLLEVTRHFALRDFTVRAQMRRKDEFNDLATSLNDMAEALDRQFRQREALSRLDYMNLAGDSIEDVLRTSVSEALTYLPFNKVELDVEAQPDGRWFRYSQMREDDVLSKTEISKSLGDTQLHTQLYKGATEAVTRHPIVVAEIVRGEIRGYHEKSAYIDSLATQQFSELADRLALALEFSEKSAELNRRAYFDELTGLPNRESCFQKIDRAIETADFNNHMVALLFIDLDGFKSVNDSLGHDAGDKLIRLAAERITRCVGKDGVTARLGGDEFAVIVPYTPGRAGDYKAIGQEILGKLQSPFTIGNSEAFLGASIGISRYPEDGNTHTELLRKADAAMYRAKDTGRGRQVEYSRTLGIVIAKRLRLEADLNRALERDELSLAFQPQINLSTGRIHGAEVLLRWHHSTEGLISPEEFIPIAEETNQILTLGNWVLFNACNQLFEWRERGIALERIAINVSANQLRHPGFLREVEECIDRFDLAPGMLELELTERVFVDSHELAGSIHALKQMGASVAIDDFGTGYSALGYLKNLEFDKVKIDRSFVGSLPHDKQAASIIQAVIAMCQTLGKPVIAEGVESSAQLKYLAAAGVELAQGFYFGKPMAAHQFECTLHACLEAVGDEVGQIVNLIES